MRTAVVLFSMVSLALSATCGQTPVKPNLAGPQTKIIGGYEAIPYSWPWQVVWCEMNWLTDKICELQCGGTVIAPGWILTAGHCVWPDLNPRNYKVKSGVFDEAKSDEDAEQVVKVKAIHLHPKYNHLLKHYDVSLVELETDLKFDNHTQPICLPKTDDTALSLPNELWVTGWGYTQEGGNVTNNLRQVDAPYVDAPTCEKDYPLPRVIDEEVEFCAGKKGIDSCQGDSGGPVVQQAKSGTWYQYGIVSWGIGCAREGRAGVYSRVTAFCDWINTTTNGVVQCQDVN